jgi:Cu-processing system ATP-binding protein
MTETVALRGVTKRYGAIVAVRDLDLALSPGEVVALVGHNGAGKTTQIKMMLASPARARAAWSLFAGDPAADGFALRRHVGYLPESVSFHLALTGRETLAFYALLKGVDSRRLDAAFETVGLDGAADRAVGTYS